MSRDKGMTNQKQANNPDAGLDRAAEYRKMADLAVKTGNMKMAEDCLDNAYLEELRVEGLKKGFIVIMTPINV